MDDEGPAAARRCCARYPCRSSRCASPAAGRRVSLIGFGMLSDTSRMRVPRSPQNRTVFISADAVKPVGGDAQSQQTVRGADPDAVPCPHGRRARYTPFEVVTLLHKFRPKRPPLPAPIRY
jgi:hypothetical protein